MIDIWILTVVLSIESSMTSFQIKLYSEDNAKQEELKWSKIKRDFYCDTFITKTQEQNYFICPIENIGV